MIQSLEQPSDPKSAAAFGFGFCTRRYFTDLAADSLGLLITEVAIPQLILLRMQIEEIDRYSIEAQVSPSKAVE